MAIEVEKLQELISFTKDICLLYVEDNDEARENTLQILEDFFQNITVAKDGEEGLSIFKEGNYDLVITDINMPKMDGIELTNHIREIATDIPILVLSAYNESNYFLDVIKAGIDGFLLKPIDIEQFIDLLKKISKNIKNSKENVQYKKNLEKLVSEKTTELNHIYSHDLATGLENTYKLNEYLEDTNYSYIILLDILNFSLISKVYGRDFSLKALKQISLSLEKNFKNFDVLLKAESDRFIVLSRLKEQNEVEELAKQINSYFDNVNIVVGEYELNINFSIGISYLDDRENAKLNVEYALESCKKVGKRFFLFYEFDKNYMEQEKETISWLKITNEMIRENQIFPYFQPMQDLKTGKIIKYEALARGKYNGEIIPPYKFINSAEILGLSTSITKSMINQSFQFFEGNSMSFSLNITEKDLLEGYLVDFLKDKSTKYAIKPEQVTLEILENISIRQNSEKIVKVLNSLQLLGYKIAVDDFGAENSNFSRLLDIEIDIIKIDAIFIKNIAKNEKDMNIVKGIVSLAKSLGMTVIAEYVESVEIYEALETCGVDIAQGYYIGKPEKELLSIEGDKI